MPKKYVVTLSESVHKLLTALTRNGTAPARVLTRARILLLAARGDTDQQIMTALHVGHTQVERIRRDFVREGVDRALFDLPRPGQARKLDPKQEAFLIALACSTPPEQRTRWTMQLLATRMVELDVVDTISDETVRRTLKKTASSPG
jgi:transposase